MQDTPALPEASVLPLFFLVLSALAGSCPRIESAYADAVVAPDGATWLLLADDAVVCWWVVDDNGDERVSARWDHGGTRWPVAIAALWDGRALLEMVDPAGAWRLVARSPDGSLRTYPTFAPAPPDAIVAHPELPLVGLRVPIDREHVRFVLVDLYASRVLASVTVGAGRRRMSFHGGDRRLWLDDEPAIALDGPGSVSDAR